MATMQNDDCVMMTTRMMNQMMQDKDNIETTRGAIERVAKIVRQLQGTTSQEIFGI